MDFIKTFLALREKEKQVAFNAREHTYTYHDRTLTSVTKLIKRHFPAFDADGKIAKKKAAEAGCSVKEIKAEWWGKAKFGTVIHSIAEQLLWYDRMQVDPEIKIEDCLEYSETYSDTYSLFVGQVSNYIEENSLEILATELIVYSPSYSVCGTIDFVLFNPVDESLILGDWKTNANIPPEGVTYGKFGFGRLAKLPSTPYYNYALQLGIYRKILEDWGFKVSDMFLIHIKKDKFERIDMPYFKDEVGAVLMSNVE